MKKHLVVVAAMLVLSAVLVGIASPAERTRRQMPPCSVKAERGLAYGTLKVTGGWLFRAGTHGVIGVNNIDAVGVGTENPFVRTVVPTGPGPYYVTLFVYDDIQHMPILTCYSSTVVVQ